MTVTKISDGVTTEFKQIGTRPVRPDGLDKVTGRAKFGADFNLPGMLCGKVLRSPHAHARIQSIDLSKASALDGVLAVICGADFPVIPKDLIVEGIVLPADLEAFSRQVIARDKVLHYGHAVAAVAAINENIAAQALQLIDVEYDVLPPVMTIDQALAADAPIIEEGLITKGASEPMVNISRTDVIEQGDVAAGFAEAAAIVDRTYSVPGVHHGYIEPPSCTVSVDEAGKVNIWCTTQGAFAVRAFTSYLVGIDLADISVTPSEIGGGFGGKLYPYIEPLAVLLSGKAGRPVKMTMTREEVFSGTSYAPAARVRIKAGAQKSGRLVAIEAHLEYESGAFSGGGSLEEGMNNMLASYAVPNLYAKGNEILVNKPNALSYRAPGSPQAFLALECVMAELTHKLGIDPVDFRLMNVNKEGNKTLAGMLFGPIGFEACLQKAKEHPHYQSELPAGQGRGIAFGCYHGGGCRSSAVLHVKENGKMVLSVGTPDIGGSRASMALMAAEVLGVPYNSITPQVVGTEMIGFSDVTGGSRTTFATGMAVVKAAEEIKRELCRRAVLEWDCEEDNVYWKEGAAYLQGTDKKLTVQELAKNAYRTGEAIGANVCFTAPMQGYSCAVNIVDVAVDKETGNISVEKVTVIQDVGTAIHPDYVEGQMQGGAAQGIGWALNEECYYGDDGTILNPGFLDYRMPVASDLPMIETVIVEVPDPNHPFGVRGAGEVPICAPMAAVAIAVNRALDTHISTLPLNPPRIMEAILHNRI